LAADEAGRYKEALYLMGNVYLRTKETADARPYYEKILKYYESDPLAVPANYNIGEMEYSKSGYKSAAGFYHKALSLLSVRIRLK